MNWILTFSYWIHLLTTVLWLGGLALMALLAAPAWRRQTLTTNQWIDLQQRFTPWVNGSMVLLWITGFVQMTTDEHYTGFLSVDSTWAWAILLKHVAVVAMTAIGLYVQFRVHPDMQRVQLLAVQRPDLAQAETGALAAQEMRLLRLNVVCAVVVLFFTAVATAA